MQNLQVQNLSVEELKGIISELVEQMLQLYLPKPKPKTEYLTRKETARLLRVSLVTLNNWTKEGIITGHRINTRVRYKSHEIEACLEEIDSIKYQRR